MNIFEELHKTYYSSISPLMLYPCEKWTMLKINNKIIIPHIFGFKIIYIHRSEFNKAIKIWAKEMIKNNVDISEAKFCYLVYKNNHINIETLYWSNDVIYRSKCLLIDFIKTYKKIDLNIWAPDIYFKN